MMNDTFDFFKNMLGSVPGMNMPGMVMPTLSVDEIEKQIKDLKAVESWLALNMSMLQGTIQALEVQKTTISTLQTMGETFSAAMQPPAMPSAPDKPAYQSPFASAASTKTAPAEQAAAPEKPVAPENATGTDKPAAHGMPADMLGAAGVSQMVNPAAWWNMLQEQFKQAVDTAAAMSPDLSAAASAGTAPATAAAAEPAKKTPAKPATGAAPRKRKASPKVSTKASPKA